MCIGLHACVCGEVGIQTRFVQKLNAKSTLKDEISKKKKYNK